MNQKQSSGHMGQNVLNSDYNDKNTFHCTNEENCQSIIHENDRDFTLMLVLAHFDDVDQQKKMLLRFKTKLHYYYRRLMRFELVSMVTLLDS